jgi:sigma-B regulation protein RsbU (phosphoserine phosphatase)
LAHTLPNLDALYAQAACGLLLTQEDGTIRLTNQTFCRWIGYEPAELVGKRKLASLFSMGAQIFHQTHWAPLLHMQGSVAEVKLDVLHRDGRAIPMVMNAVRRQHAEGVFHEIAVFVAEDRNKYEKELLLARRRADELLVEVKRQRALAEDRALFAEQMVGIVSHDLRNPLSVIRMSAAILSAAELPDPQRASIDRVVRSVDRAQRLISDLLDFTAARIGTGLPIRSKPADMHAVVSDALADLRISHPGLQVTRVIEGTGSCTVDTDRLQQLVVNLVVNAVTHGAKDRPVTVRTAIEGDSFIVTVHNEGEPIASELLPRLFDPMTRGTSDPASRSIGLGLYIVREIARAHGGSVAVESTARNGTTLTAVFPCHAVSPRPSP